MDWLRSTFSRLTGKSQTRGSLPWPQKAPSDGKEAVKIAFVGLSGVGKSSLINGLRGIFDETDPNYAKVSEIEASNKTNTYIYSNNSHVRFVEYFCTPNRPLDKSLEKVDYIVLVIGRRVTETDLELALFAERSQKQFCVVRTKFDQDIDNYSRRSSKSSNAKNALANLKKQFAENKIKLKNDLTNYILQEFRNAGVKFENKDEIFFVSDAGFQMFKETGRADVYDEWTKYQMDEDRLWKKFYNFK